MRKRLGILLESFAPSQLAAELTWSGNELVRQDVDVIGFFRNQALPAVTPLFALMPATEAFGFSGVLVATSLATAAICEKAIGPSERWFYCWDLEWLRMQQKNAKALAEAYRNPAYRLAARSADHKLALEQAWNVEVVGINERASLAWFLEHGNAQ